MLWVLAALHLSSAFAVHAIGEGKHASITVASTTEFESGVNQIRDHRYLQWMGLVMVLVAILGALLDYVLKSQAAAQLPRSALVSFFGQFYAATGVCTFLVQSLLGPRVLQRYGIGSTLAVMPAVTALLSALTMVVPRLFTVVILRGAQITLVNSFFRSAFELLYTPLPPFTKRPTKAIIDVASDRLGDMLGSGMLLVLLALSPHLGVRFLGIVIGVLALTALLVVLQLHRRRDQSQR
jgi:AAA family ATP:ADP antiporter